MARDLGLKVGDRLQLEPISQQPWRLRLSLQLPDSDEPPAPTAEPLLLGCGSTAEEENEDRWQYDAPAAPGLSALEPPVLRGWFDGCELQALRLAPTHHGFSLVV